MNLIFFLTTAFRYQSPKKWTIQYNKHQPFIIDSKLNKSNTTLYDKYIEILRTPLH